MIYKVDVGCYERGRVLTIEAPSVKSAVSKATKFLRPGEFVVQVIYDRDILWDFTRGMT